MMMNLSLNFMQNGQNEVEQHDWNSDEITANSHIGLFLVLKWGTELRTLIPRIVAGRNVLHRYSGSTTDQSLVFLCHCENDDVFSVLTLSVLDIFLE